MAHDFLPYFGKYTMNQYPPASKRKYVKVIPYRDYSVALYRAPEYDPAFEVNGLPIRELFFVLDEMGDNMLPVDCPLSSVFQCFAAIDLYLRCDNPAWRTAHPNKPLWTFVQENVSAGMKFVEVMDFMRDVQQRIINFDSTDPSFGDDPVEWREAMIEFMDSTLEKIRGRLAPITFGPDGKQVEK